MVSWFETAFLTIHPYDQMKDSPVIRIRGRALKRELQDREGRNLVLRVPGRIRGVD